MHRIDSSTATPGHQFTEGDPGAGVPATVVTAAFLNALQEELANVVEGAGIALSKPSNNQLLTAIGVLVSSALPAGMVEAFAGPTPPAGWLVANGSVVSRTTYARLFTAIGVTYGAGDGSSTFALPDLRGEFIRGWDNGRGVDSGRAFGSSQADQIKAHSHSITTIDDQENTSLGTISESSGTISLSDTRISTGSTGGNETRPRNVALLVCIKA